MDGKGFFIDLTKCTACRGCQVACKQWHKLPAEDTRNWGSYQNPKDLSFITYKLVRMEEAVENGKIKDWLFFPDQCRHCIEPPCKMVADMDDQQAVLHDDRTGAVLFTSRTKNLYPDEIKGSCPYDIPRADQESGLISKCDMCFDRVMNDRLPACVLACPTGTMHFGDMDEMKELAEKRLEEVKKIYPEAVLGDPRSVRVIYLFQTSPSKFYHSAVASLHGPRRFTRKEAFARVFKNRRPPV
ncbi:formate dehydrogenase, beta subunit, putative [Desulfonatronospira thiodismutans ASO3-1]|uniref:Formate dehydrogenase, beta subunit, putative n=1 Tax=Desulfonatronospira thiodismutans ASO3-1 TaxID=555779 RepID=D6SNN4_9BACT|nr:4Fe-4S dicluster domain-containing protein [Desulfonatronospira thiodismutans]EFI34360.1 formate dehydrogenase, beta subunit, putative [Desulfonatronospira thiodismutans ASO3-1]